MKNSWENYFHSIAWETKSKILIAIKCVNPPTISFQKKGHWVCLIFLRESNIWIWSNDYCTMVPPVTRNINILFDMNILFDITFCTEKHIGCDQMFTALCSSLQQGILISYLIWISYLISISYLILISYSIFHFSQKTHWLWSNVYCTMLPPLFASNKQKSNYNPAAANINSHLSNRLQPVYQHVASFVCVFLFLPVFHVCELFLQLSHALLADIIVKNI